MRSELTRLRQIALPVLASIALVAVQACDGDSTPAAGRCWVAWENAAGPLTGLAESDEEALDVVRITARTLYECDDVDEWREGFGRLAARAGNQPVEDLDADFNVAAFCEFDDWRAPVCRDAERLGISIETVEERLENVFEPEQ